MHIYRYRAAKKINHNKDKTRASVCSNGWYCVPSQRYQCQWVVCVRACRWIFSMLSFSSGPNQWEPCDSKQQALLSLLHFVWEQIRLAHAHTEASTVWPHAVIPKHSSRFTLVSNYDNRMWRCFVNLTKMLLKALKLFMSSLRLKHTYTHAFGVFKLSQMQKDCMQKKCSYSKQEVIIKSL